jgi:hypothetical protein
MKTRNHESIISQFTLVFTYFIELRDDLRVFDDVLGGSIIFFRYRRDGRVEPRDGDVVTVLAAFPRVEP